MTDPETPQEGKGFIPERWSLFEVESIEDTCGQCRHLLGSICIIKTHEAGELVNRSESDRACYALVRIR